MVPNVLSIAAAALLAASPALARTDLVGCTYYDSVVNPHPGNAGDAYATRIWYVPSDGEICDFLDCGGGLAPPKTTVPGCPLYKGTETYSPSYLNLKTLDGGAAAKTEAATHAGHKVKESAHPEITAKATIEASATATAAATTTTAKGKAAKGKAGKAAAHAKAHAEAKSSSAATAAAATDKTGAATTPAASPVSTTKSEAGAAMPTALGMMGSLVAAGAAVYAGLL